MKMNKLFTFAVFLALSFLLGNSALAQNYQKVGEINFNGLNCPDYGLRNNVVWNNNTLSSIQNRDLFIQLEDRDDVSFRVDETNVWNLGQSSELNNNSYFQNGAEGNNGNSWKSVYIDNLKQDDKIILTTNPGKQCAIWSNNTNISLENPYYFTTTSDNPSIEFTVTADGSVQIQCVAQYSGIHKIELYVPQEEEQKDPFFNYDPGYEVYDLFEVRDWILDRNNNGDITSGPTKNTDHTDYSVSDAGFNLNGSEAQYFTYDDNDLTLNNRVAIDQSGRWRFARGLIVPEGDNNEPAYFSITNLKRGDRIQIFYTGENPIFASQADGTYNGCPGFYDKWNDGDFNPEDGDHFFTPESQVEYIASLDRVEGTIRRDEQLSQEAAMLHSSAVYVVAEDGHMDFRLNNTNPLTRIIKIYIWSDHQATMIDDYSERDYQYTSRFDITGELQAKEHIVPGGLEVRIGNEDKSQHAIVVSSKDGAVSYVNAVDGFKLPGVTKNENTENIELNFNLGGNNVSDIPTTGTFYKFMPLESGTMQVKFTAYSMYYYRYDINGNALYYDNGGGEQDYTEWRAEFGRSNEQTVNRACPYYVKVSEDNGSTFDDVTGITWNSGSSQVANGSMGEFTLDVEAGKIYYLFGGWTSGANGDNTNLNDFSPNFIRDINSGALIPHGCGVAELFDVAFTPGKQIYPLAKWVPSGTEEDDDLAFIVGYQESELTVKKMSGNITSCHPYIYSTTDDEGNTIHKLGIKDVKFKSGENPGGVVLIKFGTTKAGETNYYKVDPVYVFTVAYDANYHSTSNYAEEARGHTWDFSSSSLNGLDWDTTIGVPTRNLENDDAFENDPENQNFAEAQPFGTYFNDYFGNGENSGVNNNSFLYHEMNYVDNGVNRSDWMFNYRLQKNGLNYDPRFLNKYDMEGDNADMIWDTEGIIIEANSNMSCIFNEFGNGNTHSSTTDPDRYVGILSGGSFLIPHLNKNDRVIIWMGSGTDSDELIPEDMKFHITNARDALYEEILEDDVYLAGGSHWDGANGDKNYRGCYHFFALDDGDMKFTLEGSNSICKLYKIQIYTGDRINTNEIVGATNDDKFLLVTTEKDPNDETETVGTKGAASNWTLQYFGKNQKLADGSNDVNNDIVAQTGKITKSLITDTDEESDNYNTFTYPHDYGEIGTIRVRGKDMEKNMKYVADYGDHNVTVAYQETQKYPYTWDFKDMTLYNSAAFGAEDDIAPTKPEWFDSNAKWNTSYEKSSQDLSLWVANENTYVLRLNSQNNQVPNNLKEKDNIFQTDYPNYNGNQLWANGEVVSETKGLWFYTDNNNRGAGQWHISDEGMELNGSIGWCHKMVVPNVPTNGAVYLRMMPTKNADFTAQFMKDNANCEIYGPIQVGDNNNEYIFAILNTGEKQNLRFTFDGYKLLRLAVSSDFKTLDKNGWATESREHVVDPALTAYMTGKDIETCFVTGIVYNETNPRKGGQLNLVRANLEDNSEGDIVRASKDGDLGGCILHNTAGEPVSILGGGFHLFVPDMHDYDDAISGDYSNNGSTGVKTIAGENLLKAQVTEGDIPATDGNYTNYILSNKRYKSNEGDGTLEEYIEAFYRVSTKKAAHSYGNNAYLQLLTEMINPSTANGFTLTFGDGSDADGINEVFGTNENTNNSIYTIDGNKLETMPTRSGVYIINGKKVVIR